MAKKKKKAAAKKPLSQAQVIAELAEQNDLSRAQVREIFDSLSDLIAKNLKKSGPQAFTLPGLCKMVVKRKPATKARKGVNPFTGEEMMFKAKPASNVVKIRPLKGLKDMV
ncbi:MAG: HU family DNA-binding protein [Phycisphaeraceae bacterium]|nr:HU family DNA-binding protein [Phycisphaeraceae bacterium]